MVAPLITIAYVVSTLSRCGPTNQLLNIVSNLDPALFRPVILTLSPEPRDSLKQRFIEKDIAVESMRLGRVSGLALAQRRLKAFMEDRRPALIHTQGLRADRLASRCRAGVPRLATVRNFPQLDYPMTYGRILGSLMASAHARALERLESVVGVSDAVTGNLREHYGLARLATVSNGVDVDRFSVLDASAKAAHRKALGLDIGGELWISTGHLAERKDPLAIVRAWKAVFPQTGDRRLVFLGDGPMRDKCVSQARADIVFAGRVDNVQDYLQVADVYVSASHAEGLPNSVIEALACGLPVVLSDIAPHREIWTHDPQIGCLYRVGDETALANSIKAMLQADVSQASRRARKLALEIYSAKRMSRRYQTLYGHLIGQGA